MAVFERADKENTNQTSGVMTASKWMLVVLLFVFMLAMYLFEDYEHLKDYYGEEKEKSAFVGLRYTCFFFAIACYGRIGYRVINVFMRERMLRYKRLGAMSIFVIVLSLICKMLVM